MHQPVHWLLGLEVFNCSLRIFSKIQSMLTGWLCIAHIALHCCCMTVLTPAMPPFRNFYHSIGLLLLAASPDALLLPISLRLQKHPFITCLDLLPIWSPFSALVSRSSDHLLSCCCFFCSMPISRSLKYPRNPWSRHTPFSIQNLLPWIAPGFHSPPHCASQLILMSTLPCLHIFSKLFDSSTIILPSPPAVEAAASCSNPSLPS